MRCLFADNQVIVLKKDYECLMWDLPPTGSIESSKSLESIIPDPVTPDLTSNNTEFNVAKSSTFVWTVPPLSSAFQKPLFPPPIHPERLISRRSSMYSCFSNEKIENQIYYQNYLWNDDQLFTADLTANGLDELLIE